MKLSLVTLFVISTALCSVAQENQKPIELDVLKGSIGVWDAEIEVWPAGLDAPSTQFKGVETNRPHGEYWIASDFDSQFMGQSMKVHSIVGYDLDKKQLVATVIDDGPYAASMTGEYAAKSKTVSWTTHVKDAKGNPIVQKTTISHQNADERLLVLSVPDKATGAFKMFMRIKFVKRK
ncbi:MAG: DUF1579 family protein [Pirellulaceae bacterium]|nr:DUF1579 family protein [Pirellulaceae bacterium]